MHFRTCLEGNFNFELLMSRAGEFVRLVKHDTLSIPLWLVKRRTNRSERHYFMDFLRMLTHFIILMFCVSLERGT